MLTLNHADVSDPVYLKPEVKFEPLVCRWYAWPHLLAPVTLALHLHYRLLPLLRSFVENPAVHVAANRDPAMYGGPFVSLDEAEVGRAKALLEETTGSCATLTGLAGDLRRFNAQLRESATGFSLNALYAELPESLCGLVELLYDTEHRASVRLFEPLVNLAYPTAATQQVMLHMASDDSRPFFMSTPRLETTDSLSLAMPFSDPRIDRLAAMRTRPAPLAELATLLDLDDAHMPLLRAMCQATAPHARPDREHADAGVRMRYFGHACLLFQTADTSILFDPFVSIEDTQDGRFSIHDLPDRIDWVVITHAHQDHFSPEMLLQLRHRIGHVIVPANNSGAVADPSMKLALQQLGFASVTALDCLERVALPGGSVLSLPFTGEHADLNIYSKHAILLELLGKKFMFLVDSDGRDPVLYERIRQQTGPIDAMFIGMECQGAPLNWLYEPVLDQPVNRRNNESRRLSGADHERAAAICAIVAPRRVFVYAMGQEPWMRHIMGLQYSPDSIQLTESDRFVAHCQAQDIQAERLYGSRELRF